MTRAYSPACVRDPRSMYHLVRLRPAQELAILLSKEKFNTPDIELSSPYLQMARTTDTGDDMVFLISQSDTVKSWAQYSSTYLGEIWLTYKEGISRLLVLQDCTSPQKANYVTSVNPECYDLRVLPQNVLEFILFDPNFGPSDYWEWEWISKQESAKVSLLRCETKGIFPNKIYEIFEPPSDPFAKLSRFDPKVNDRYRRQHHFWFRFDKAILSLLNTETGMVHVGNFNFSGHSWPNSPEMQTHHASVFVNLKKNSAVAFQQVQSQPILPVYPRRFQCYIKKQVLPIVNEVDITRIETSTLAEGCKTVPADPVERQYVNEYDDYDLREYCSFPLRYHQKFRRD